MHGLVRATIPLIGAAALALAACTAHEVERGGTAPIAAAEAPSAAPAAGGVVRRGDSFATMADQYAPREVAGPVATGASAWVPPAPASAFVAAAPLPPADPPAPPPAAVANRQPAAPASAAEIQRPEAAVPAPAAPDPALRTAGRALFNAMSCGTCHIFADAGGSGAIGPSLDDNPRLTRDLAIDVIENGSGAMPSFGGQMTAAELATLADYLAAFSRK